MPPCKAKRERAAKDAPAANKKAKKKAKQTVSTENAQEQQHLLPVWWFDQDLSALYCFDHWAKLLSGDGIATLRKLPSKGLDAGLDYGGTLVIVRENSAAAGRLIVHGARRVNHTFVLRCLGEKKEWRKIAIEQYAWTAPVASLSR